MTTPYIRVPPPPPPSLRFANPRSVAAVSYPAPLRHHCSTTALTVPSAAWSSRRMVVGYSSNHGGSGHRRHWPVAQAL
uniref:Uncharacterized protein n=1 Tax=Arundo donax TaxID=35708 RepID=A0A0A8Y0F8_ARUDO